jgi:7,8-dihydropterin-6-yl-methyl-4-(beta-D-ribofuranosyl)aminobenzene 5'-phosphate synthase
MENGTISDGFTPAHGLSLFIETKKHKILFDLGPNSDYLNHAKKLDVCIQDADIIVVSHGHYDHGKKLEELLSINNNASVYVSTTIFEPHLKLVQDEYIDIGLQQPKDDSRITFINKNIVIDEEIEFVCDVPYVDNVIKDTALYTYRNNKYQKDTFDHELYMIVHENNHHILFSGCSHKGIEHIIDTIEERKTLTLTHVVGGFHFSHYNPLHSEEVSYLKQLSQKFLQREDTMFYSGHCTGERAFSTLKSVLTDQLRRIKTGEIINI